MKKTVICFLSYRSYYSLLSQINKPRKDGVRLKLFLQNEIAATASNLLLTTGKHCDLFLFSTLIIIISRWPVFAVFMEQFVKITGKATHDSSYV
jgi:hypothetical protein